MNRVRWFALVVGLQAALLFGWAVSNEVNRSTSPTILLETAPVDPRDLLRGDYMILNYKISRVPEPTARPATGQTFDGPGNDIWVVLQQKGRFHEVVSVSWSEPATVAVGLVVVRGRTRSRVGFDQMLQVDYGIEKYFVPEGKGTPTFNEMVVEATVSRQHRLGIKRLLLDGQPYP
jgi:uncharacterized membrane-anchored protein